MKAKSKVIKTDADDVVKLCKLKLCVFFTISISAPYLKYSRGSSLLPDFSRSPRLPSNWDAKVMDLH